MSRREASVIEFEVLGASFCLWSAASDAVLAPFVTHIWASTGSPSFAAERVVPDGGSVLIFNLGRALSMQAAGADALMREVFFAGPTTRWADVHYGFDATHEQVGVLFPPGGAAVYFGSHAEALRDVACESSMLPTMRLDLGRVSDALREASSRSERTQILARALRLAVGSHATKPITQRIMAMMRRHPHESVKAQAARAGWSQQHLHRVLRRESGMGTKELQQVVRLQETLSALDQLRAKRGGDGEESLARLASTQGFVDQAHLTNTLRAMTGLTPRGPIALAPRAVGRVLYVPPTAALK